MVGAALFGHVGYRVDQQLEGREGTAGVPGLQAGDCRERAAGAVAADRDPLRVGPELTGPGDDVVEGSQAVCRRRGEGMLGSQPVLDRDDPHAAVDGQRPAGGVVGGKAADYESPAVEEDQHWTALVLGPLAGDVEPRPQRPLGTGHLEVPGPGDLVGRPGHHRGGAVGEGAGCLRGGLRRVGLVEGQHPQEELHLRRQDLPVDHDRLAPGEHHLGARGEAHGRPEGRTLRHRHQLLGEAHWIPTRSMNSITALLKSTGRSSIGTWPVSSKTTISPPSIASAYWWASPSGTRMSSAP